MSSNRAATGAALIGAAALALMWASGGRYRPGPTDARIRHLPDAGRGGAAGPGLAVLSWNLAWGYGWGSEGSGPRRPPGEVDARLGAMAQVIREVGADVVLLQEVDFDSARSGRVDQAERIARVAGYPWIAPIVGWRMGYLPFPGVDPRGHWGRMRSGGAILSRLPLSAPRGWLLPKPGGNSWIYNLFYIGRYFQMAEVAAPFGPVEVANLHLDAFDGDSRREQARIIAGIMAGQEGPWIVGGDFNTVAPEATVRGAYDDEPDTDHDGDTTLPTFRSLPGAVEIVNEGEEAAGFTFPAHASNRRLDHALVRGLSTSPGRVVVEAGDLSDHLPILFSVSPPVRE